MFHLGPSLWLGDVQQSCPIFLILTGVRMRFFTLRGFKLLFHNLLRNCQPDLKTVQCAHHIQKNPEVMQQKTTLPWAGKSGEDSRLIDTTLGASVPSRYGTDGFFFSSKFPIHICCLHIQRKMKPAFYSQGGVRVYNWNTWLNALGSS